METKEISREALLRSLDSLEQICVKRMKNERLIDDKELSGFVLNIKRVTTDYAVLNKMPELANVSSEFPEKFKIRTVPYLIEIIWIILVCFLVFSLAFWGIYGLFIMISFLFYPLILPGAILVFVRYGFDRKRNILMNRIAGIAFRAKKLLST
jgi:hypothetical protein